MFPLNNSDEMIFHVSSTTSHQQNIIPQDLIFIARANNSVDSTILTSNINLGQGLSETQLLETNDLDDNNNNNTKKKIMHREIEKQRRKEMASLHSELRSLIPLEYIKGKRSISDHMNTATNYIKHLKTKISELSVQRDNLIKESSYMRSSSTTEFGVTSCFAVQNCLVGVEIILSSSTTNNSPNGYGLPLSTVLQLLIGKGLVLFSCVTTKASEIRLLHTIQAEVSDETCTDLAELRQTLDDTISLRNK